MQKCIFIALVMTRDSVENETRRLESRLGPELPRLP